MAPRLGHARTMNADKLQIPDIPVQHGAKDDKQRLQRLCHRHTELHLAANIYPIEQASGKASKEISAVTKCFPTVSDDNTLLAMAAWFALLCLVDDSFEALPPDEGRDAITESIQILSDEHSRASSTNSTPSDHEPRASRIRRITVAFRDHVLGLIPPQLYKQLCWTITDYLRGLLQESFWRLVGSSDEAHYLSIRAVTIGVRPFMLLLQHHFDIAVENEDLEAMMSNVCLAIGMQNDIIGLQKDLLEGERFNYLLLVPSEPLELRRAKAIGMHNRAVNGAVRCRMMLANSLEPGLRACADALLIFLNRHFLWATFTKRYAPRAAGSKLLRFKTKSEFVAVLRWAQTKQALRKRSMVGLSKACRDDVLMLEWKANRLMSDRN